MKKTFKALSGHTMFVKSIKFEDLPEHVKKFEYIADYPKHYVVKNWDDEGVTFMYLATGHKGFTKQIVAWYRGGGFWSGYYETIESAINGAQKSGWLHA